MDLNGQNFLEPRIPKSKIVTIINNDNVFLLTSLVEMSFTDPPGSLGDLIFRVYEYIHHNLSIKPIILFFSLQESSGHVIYSAMWKPDGRYFEEIGRYCKNHLEMRQTLFPTEKYGFNGRNFIVTINFVSSYMAL